MVRNDDSKTTTIGEQLRRAGIPRRDFLKFCTELMIAAPVGLAITKKAWAGEVAADLLKIQRPPVVWLHFQDCTGCTETLLRTSRPSVDHLIFNIISLDYHETLMPGSGKQAEKATARSAIEGKEPASTSLVCEGSIPTKMNGNYLKMAGRRGTELLQDIGSKAAAIIAMGSCASWGGVPFGRETTRRARSASPNCAWRAHRQYAGLPAQSLHPDRHDSGDSCAPDAPPQLDSEFASEVCLRPRDPRAVPAPRALRLRPLCPGVWRRRPSPGLVPVQAGLQRSRYARGLLGASVQRDARRLADRHRRSLRGLYREGSSVQGPDVRAGVGLQLHPAEHLSAASRTARDGRRSIASGVAGVFVGAGVGAAWAAAQSFKSSQERR